MQFPLWSDRDRPRRTAGADAGQGTGRGEALAPALLLALALLGLIDGYEFVVQLRLVGHGATLCAGLSTHVDLKLVSRLELGSEAMAMRYEPRR